MLGHATVQVCTPLYKLQRLSKLRPVAHDTHFPRSVCESARKAWQCNTYRGHVCGGAPPPPSRADLVNVTPPTPTVTIDDHRHDHGRTCQRLCRTSPWVVYVRGARLEMFYRDIMHIVYLGFARDLIASVIVDELPAGSPDVKNAYLRELSRQMNEWFKSKRMVTVRRVFTLSNIGREKQTVYAELGSSFKAAAVKAMIYYFAHRLSNAPTPHRLDKVRCCCVWGLADFLYKIDSGPLNMPLYDRAD
jgi:hypothetical protein